MAIGEVFLSAFLQVFFEEIISGGKTPFLKLIGGDDLPKTMKKWKQQLAKLEAVQEDAELQQFHDKNVRSWLNNLRRLSYDIEDFLDDLAIQARRYEMKKAEEHATEDGSYRGFLDYVVQTICESSSHAADSLSSLFNPINKGKIDEITECLQDLENEMHTLNLTAHKMQLQTIQTPALRDQRESSSVGSDVFGRDVEKKEIITMLLKDDQNADGYVVIPIIGPGGIGKTTLAQYVYNDEQRYVYRDELFYDEQHKSNFDFKAWVCVSDVFDVKRVTIDIINSPTQGKFGCSNLNEAQVKLQRDLNGKKFLIVLDDIWSDNYALWEKLQIPFQGGAKGSRVLMTTRSKKIAMKMTKNQNTIISLRGLSDDGIWCLFQSHSKTDDSDIKEAVLQKCKGLPLAAKALGGLLKSTTEKSEREQILESNVWGEEYEECEVLPVLQLSYHHMPSHLKRVFAYCSVFPKDYKFDEMELVLLWMAQGFLPQAQNERMEDIGHKYFNDLVSRSLFEKVLSFDEEGSFDEEWYIMHDLIHDVAQLAAGDVCYVMDSKSEDLDDRIRHLYITEHVQTLGNQSMFPLLRTFLCNYDLKFDLSNFFKNICYIRSLSLVSDKIEVLPECIGDLIHLRYLRLKFGRIEVLPKSINNLWNLQTLCLRGCCRLEKIPDIGSLEKLRHMYIRYDFSMMPIGIGKLTELQTLDKFVLAAGGGSRVKELGMLNHLRGKLHIIGLENVTEIADAEEAQLHKKESLEELYMGWGTYTDEVDDMTKRGVIEKLQPHTNIKECELEGYMGSLLPSWLGDPSYINMESIVLERCAKCKCLPPLGQLYSLKSLHISAMDGIKEVGLEFYGHCITPFPSLKELYFSDMESWEKWVHPSVDNNKAFPILENLYISECSSWQGDLPPHLPSIRFLKIYGCKQLRSLELKNNSPSSNSSLEELYVIRCDSLGSICNIPLTLQSLEIKGCEKLDYVEFDEQPTNLSPQSDDEKGLKSEESRGVSPKASLELPLLTKLSIKRCPNLRSLQQSLLPRALKTLELRGCKNMEMLPVQLLNLTSFEELIIDDSTEIHSLTEGGLPTSLRSLAIIETKIDKPIKEWGLHLLTSLASLTLQNVGSCVDTVESIGYPDFPSSLSFLQIKGFQNLKTIYCSTLPTLSWVDIKNCPKLESFGDINAFPHQCPKWVFIDECDMIEQHLTCDPNGLIRTKNGRYSLPLSGSQPTSYHSGT